MRLVRRYGLAVLLALLVVFPLVASADATPVITVEKMLQTGEPGYYEPGDTVTFRYEVTANDRFASIVVTDDKCAPVVPVLATSGPNAGYNVGDTVLPYGQLNGLAGETWVYTCTTTAPAWVDPAATSVGTAHVSADSVWAAWAQDNPFTDDDTFTLTAVAQRKAVFVFWNYNVGIVDPAAANVAFTVDVKNGATIAGTETLSVDDPLLLWFAPGSWTLKERTPPAGYRVFDGRDTRVVDLSPGWRDDSFVNGSDFDLAISKATVSPYTKVGGTIVYEYTVTNSGPAAVTPLVTDDACSPVTYHSGDTSGDGKIQSTETWRFRCSKVLTQGLWDTSFTTPPRELKNTATVVADEADTLLPAYPGGPVFGGDTNAANSTAVLKLEPVVLRKLVVLYWDYVNSIPAPGTGAVAFPVDLVRNATTVGTETVSANNPLYLMLAPGSWSLQEGTPPAGYAVLRGTWNIGATPSTGYLDNTFFDQQLFDLAIEKTGPEWRYAGSTVTYTYEVTNTGPAAVTPTVSDDKCSPVAYVSGDTSGDGKIQVGETWVFKCTTTPTWASAFPAPLVNTATVADLGRPSGAPWNLGNLMGGDTTAANDTDTYRLYPFVLRKEVGLYNDGLHPDFGAFADDTAFSVKMYRGAVYKTTFTISESSPRYLWLSSGTWKFTEVGLPAGYFAFYPDATIAFTTGTYPDWTHLNVTWSGCSHGYWKNHTPWPATYDPTDLVSEYFTGSGFGASTLTEALAFGGGNGVAGAEQILLRQAVAALLNEARYGTAFGPYAGVGALETAVSAALAGDNRGTMLTLAGRLDSWNNGVCR